MQRTANRRTVKPNQSVMGHKSLSQGFTAILLAIRVAGCPAPPYKAPSRVEVPWQSGYARDCKSRKLGSIPGGTSSGIDQPGGGAKQFSRRPRRVWSIRTLQGLRCGLAAN